MFISVDEQIFNLFILLLHKVFNEKIHHFQIGNIQLTRAGKKGNFFTFESLFVIVSESSKVHCTLNCYKHK